MSKERVKSVTIRSDSLRYSLAMDISMLVKMRLTVLVVISALLAYLIAADGTVDFLSIIILGLGGFAITGAANALNQALEKDYDKLMKRTADRPVAAGRMTMSTAIMIGGILFVVGIILLAFFNPLAAVLGATAMVSYAFLYTPMKRISPMSVFVGAIPGALPAMIGVVAFEGSITSLALVLFGIQFFWQFPHFWSIGYLGFEDYKKAGFKLVPELDGEVHPQIGLQSMIFAFLLLPFSVAPYLLGTSSLWTCLIVAALGIGYAYFGWLLHTRRGVAAARSLMFYSFAYLPIVLFIYYLGNL